MFFAIPLWLFLHLLISTISCHNFACLRVTFLIRLFVRGVSFLPVVSMFAFLAFLIIAHPHLLVQHLCVITSIPHLLLQLLLCLQAIICSTSHHILTNRPPPHYIANSCSRDWSCSTDLIVIILIFFLQLTIMQLAIKALIHLDAFLLLLMLLLVLCSFVFLGRFVILARLLSTHNLVLILYVLADILRPGGVAFPKACALLLLERSYVESHTLNICLPKSPGSDHSERPGDQQ
jgi:hypothetical protein